MSIANSKQIKIPTQHYVGFQKRNADEVPLAFMTPEGTDQASVKRKTSVDNWARGNTWQAHDKQATLAPKTLDNKPMTGFKFGRLIGGGGRGWDARSDAWRIEDPRGFQLELGSGNVEEIMSVCTIEKGEILEECIWGRLGTNNILIPVTSDAYEVASENTVRLGTTVSVKEAKPGMHLIFKNGTEGMYLGRNYAVGYSQYEAVDPEKKCDYDNRKKATTYNIRTLNPKPIHTYIMWNGADRSGSGIVMRDSLSLSEVRTYKDLTQEEACIMANDLIAQNKWSVDINGKYGDFCQILFIQPTDKVENVDWRTELTTIGTGDAELKDWLFSQKEGEGYASQYVLASAAAHPGKFIRTHASYHPAHPSTHVLTNFYSYNSYAILPEPLYDPINGMVRHWKEKHTETDYWRRGQISERHVMHNWEKEPRSDFTYYTLTGHYKTFNGVERTKNLTDHY